MGFSVPMHVFSRTVAAVDTKRGYVGMCNGHSAQQVWNAVVKEQRVYGGGHALMCTFLVKAESGGYQTWICG